MNEILFALWFYLPAGAANMAPVFAKRVKFLDKLDVPLDFGKHFYKKRIFGDHKTLRGLVSGYVFALITIALQAWLYSNASFFSEISFIDYSSLNLWLVSGLFTIGALGGDAAKSFFKRQANINPGKSWTPFDQVDWIIGAVLISLLFTNFELNVYLWAIAWGLLLHPISTVIGWFLKLKEEPI